MNNFFAGTNMSKKTITQMIDKFRNTQNAKSITDPKDFELNNSSTLSRLSLSMAASNNLEISSL